jgi:hypothetical protein
MDRKRFTLEIPWPNFNKVRLTRLLPTPGNVIFTLVMIALLVAAQTAGALPLPVALRAPAAASTGTIAYQGRLADAAGAPLTGTYNMIFRLNDASTGGTPLWSEEWIGSNGVKVSDGLFNVMLGSLSQLPISQFTNAQSLFLGITVGTDDEMAPRVQLGSVPFAVHALTVPDGSVTTAKIADKAVTQAKLGADVSLVPPDGSVTTAKLADGAVTPAKLDRSYLNKSGDTMAGVLNMSGSTVSQVGNLYGIGSDSAQLHMPGGVNEGGLYINWHSGEGLYFGGGKGIELFSVDTNGNLRAKGAKSAVVETAHFGDRKLYAIEAPDVRFSDEGVARLQSGVARVELDPIFLETIEGEYLVHVTPYGDASLYVAKIGQDYFVVKARDGDPNVTFAWRLSATRKGYAGVRLEDVK